MTSSDLAFQIRAGLTLLMTAATIVYARKVIRQRSGLPLPPGPPRLPIVGSAFHIPTTQPGAVYQQWAKEYDSDILYIDAMGQSIIVLSAYKDAFELLERRSGIYSDRLHIPMAIGLMDMAQWNFGVMAYGDAWRARRRLFHRTLNEKATKTFEPHVKNTARHLIQLLAESPEDFDQHLLFTTGRSLLSIAYGLDISSPEDPYLSDVATMMETASSALLPGKYLVDTFPVLRHVPDWFPGAQFKRDAKAWKELGRQMVKKPFEAAKRLIADGISPPSFVSANLDSEKTTRRAAEDEQVIAETAAVMYAAGTETTHTGLSTFILAMTLHPEAQRQAQAELDRILLSENGRSRLPSFEDLDELPYIQALLLEVLRWNPPVTIGVPHLSTSEEDDEFKGYLLPRKSLIIPNAWAMMHNEDIFPNPEQFDPNRFIGPDGKLDPGVLDPRKVIFGFGRRICPGRHLTLSSMWISMASILAIFHIEPTDESPVEPAFEEASIIRHPRSFKCSIKPRSGHTEESIRDMIAVYSSSF